MLNFKVMNLAVYSGIAELISRLYFKSDMFEGNENMRICVFTRAFQSILRVEEYPTMERASFKFYEEKKPFLTGNICCYVLPLA